MENTVAQKIDALSKVQQIDSDLDAIRKLRGDLPEEVQDLEDEIVGFETRIDNLKRDLGEVEANIDQYRGKIQDFKKRIVYLEEQQMNVRNNREFDAITKEMEMLDLDIQVAQKKIRDNEAEEKIKRERVLDTKERLDERRKDLTTKKAELDEIMAESEVDEQKLLKQREKATKHLDERLLRSYTKIRDNSSNGLAVVSVKRGACGGCFNTVPPQRQADIREKKKLIVCEHCGRILTDVEIIEEPEPAPKRRSTRGRKATTKKK
ncbi:hypothetical protein KMW28_10670 [Flammeovirga yaeyamensis]|uniref:C4-type zinc ribbon domain-containing protein n=1 Tax=Flammeovirga yaeyamensis TaxID=367791 RepID=A0AAX1N176_9BACT|nr:MULTISPECIES: C4-type zinc ribbon domain-containing protein [Flammeovirga]ANQ48478.1 hypothetical protein MY04_1101 [Flammeovirga sp. MY04]MBB3696382.1 hypothetical protein [Flammeovirga yaeyamensis]NMF35061.1 hypothetical protein [Flammeovirga yaeyamensis]QWG00116.1 hypothetical protein KMW28_10670 [Flammeovirga yaeyamensis]